MSLSDKISKWEDSIKRKRSTLEVEEVRESVKELKTELGTQYYYDKAWQTIKRIINEVFGDELTKSDVNHAVRETGGKDEK